MKPTDKAIEYYQSNNKSGWLKIIFGVGFLVIAIPLIVWGIIQASGNGIIWVTKRPERKLSRQQRRESTLQTKLNTKRLKEEYKDLKNKNHE